MEVAGLARKDSVVTLGLSRRAVEDSRALKIIAVLTLFYLPASFVAVSQMTPVSTDIQLSSWKENSNTACSHFSITTT